MDMPMPAPRAEASLVADIDRVLQTARAGGIDSAMIEIRPPRAADQGWMVREYDRQWPTQVDTIVIDPANLAITSRADFETFPLVAKLIRWGIDAHMGILFGLANQAVMAVLGFALMTTIVYGYRIWWMRRPAPGAPPKTLVRSFSYLSSPWKAAWIIAAFALGWALPVLGVSLFLFVLVDLGRSWLANRRRERLGLASPAE
jgi:uncharacterized iron-regulated membrane protein